MGMVLGVAGTKFVLSFKTSMLSEVFVYCPFLLGQFRMKGAIRFLEERFPNQTPEPSIFFGHCGPGSCLDLVRWWF